MGNISDRKLSCYRKSENEILEETIKRLESAIELKDQGKEEEGNAVVNDLKAWLEGNIQAIEDVISAEKKSVDRTLLPLKGESFSEGKNVYLKVISDDEKEKYIEVSRHYSYWKNKYELEEFREAVWKDFVSDEAFVCSIYDKSSEKYVGYCSVKNLAKDDWELAIELRPEMCHKGYGFEALSVFMRKLHQLSNKRFFRARVEVDNHASQGLMRKLGAIPNGISEFLLHGEEIEKFQNENKELITDDVRKVADEFCMDAEDILGYVLEYRFDMNDFG